MMDCAKYMPDDPDALKCTETGGPGNTRRALAKTSKRHRNWCFTWNNHTEANINALENLKSCDYIFQPEIGESGTPHLQGCLLFKQPKAFNQIKSLLPGAHIETMKYRKKAIAYCMKSETKTGPRHTNMAKYKEIYDVLDDHTPYEWQQNVINIVKGKPDPRKIHWIWESKGNRGKTILCKHLVLKYGAIIVGGRCKDAMYAITQRLANDKLISIVVFDIPRSSYNHLSYPALEKIKDGLFFSSKYESGMVCYDIPHVLVFSNNEPERELLSRDRWDIISLTRNGNPLTPGGTGGELADSLLSLDLKMNYMAYED